MKRRPTSEAKLTERHVDITHNPTHVQRLRLDGTLSLGTVETHTRSVAAEHRRRRRAARPTTTQRSRLVQPTIHERCEVRSIGSNRYEREPTISAPAPDVRVPARVTYLIDFATHAAHVTAVTCRETASGLVEFLDAGLVAAFRASEIRSITICTGCSTSGASARPEHD